MKTLALPFPLHLPPQLLSISVLHLICVWIFPIFCITLSYSSFSIENSMRNCEFNVQNALPFHARSFNTHKRKQRATTRITKCSCKLGESKNAYIFCFNECLPVHNVTMHWNCTNVFTYLLLRPCMDCAHTYVQYFWWMFCCFCCCFVVLYCSTSGTLKVDTHLNVMLRSEHNNRWLRVDLHF